MGYGALMPTPPFSNPPRESRHDSNKRGAHNPRSDSYALSKRGSRTLASGRTRAGQNTAATTLPLEPRRGRRAGRSPTGATLRLGTSSPAPWQEPGRERVPVREPERSARNGRRTSRHGTETSPRRTRPAGLRRWFWLGEDTTGGLTSNSREMATASPSEKTDRWTMARGTRATRSRRWVSNDHGEQPRHPFNPSGAFLRSNVPTARGTRTPFRSST